MFLPHCVVHYNTPKNAKILQPNAVVSESEPYRMAENCLMCVTCEDSEFGLAYDRFSSLTL
jgi:hypothetical protein